MQIILLFVRIEEDDIDEPELAVAQEEEAEEVEEEEVPPYIDIPSQRPFRAEEEPLSPPRRYTELERSVVSVIYP